MSFTVHRDGALEYLRADALAGAIHCFSTRFGGVSTGYLKSLNLGVHRGDTPENVEKALVAARDFADAHGVDLITINSWNEWTEMSYLLPDKVYGTGYLDQIKKIFG